MGQKLKSPMSSLTNPLTRVVLTSSPAVRDLRGFRQTSQSEHRNHAEQWTWRKNDECIRPAKELLDDRNEFDRHRRQQETNAGLNSQRRPDVLRIGELGDASGKLG